MTTLTVAIDRDYFSIIELMYKVFLFLTMLKKLNIGVRLLLCNS